METDSLIQKTGDSMIFKIEDPEYTVHLIYNGNGDYIEKYGQNPVKSENNYNAPNTTFYKWGDNDGDGMDDFVWVFTMD